MSGIFNHLFDLNHDGKVSELEKILGTAAFAAAMDEEKKRKEEADSEYSGIGWNNKLDNWKKK